MQRMYSHALTLTCKKKEEEPDHPPRNADSRPPHVRFQAPRVSNASSPLGVERVMLSIDVRSFGGHRASANTPPLSDPTPAASRLASRFATTPSRRVAQADRGLVSRACCLGQDYPHTDKYPWLVVLLQDWLLYGLLLVGGSVCGAPSTRIPFMR